MDMTTKRGKGVEMMRTEVYRQFKQSLFSGKLKPGQFVSQRELASLFGAPLAPVREAIRQLDCEQLIRVFPQRGIQIVEADPKTINDGHDYRLLLEVNAARDFALNAPLEKIRHMRVETETAIKVLKRDPADEAVKLALETAWDFHEVIVDFQGNSIISHHYRLNSARIRLFRSSTSQPKEFLPTALHHHLAILSACAKRDGDEAVRLIAEDIERSRAIILGLRADGQPQKYLARDVMRDHLRGTNL
jgi:DNA-binding GntR family transcriptional regulator